MRCWGCTPFGRLGSELNLGRGGALLPQATMAPAIALPAAPAVTLMPWSALPGPGVRAGTSGAVFGGFTGFPVPGSGVGGVSGFPGFAVAPQNPSVAAVVQQSAATATGSPQPMGGEPSD